MKCFIEVACQELSFRGNDESESSLHKGNFIETMHLLAVYNPILKNHVDSSITFSGLSSDIQNDLISSISYVTLEKFHEELSSCDFIGLLLNKFTDISTKSQLSVFLRYVLNNGDVVERFFGFADVSLGRSAQDIFDFIVPFMKKRVYLKNWLVKVMMVRLLCPEMLMICKLK